MSLLSTRPAILSWLKDGSGPALTPILSMISPRYVGLLLVTLLGGAVTYYIWYQRTLSRRLGGVPVIHKAAQGRSVPYLGHALNFLRFRPWDLLTDWHRTYGPLVCFTLIGKTFFSVQAPELTKQVLQSKIAGVKKDIYNTYKHFLVILGTGIVTSEDTSWMKQRLKLSHPLRQDILQIIPTQTIVAVQHLMQKLDTAAESGNQVPLAESLRHLTLQVISGAFLSLSAEESDTSFAQLYMPIVDESNKRVWHPYRAYLFFLPFWWKYLWNVRQLNVYVSTLIRKRWALRRSEDQMDDAEMKRSKRALDILDLILKSCEKELLIKSATLPRILPEAHVRQLRDEMKTFMLAGHETSAAMMTWALYEFMGESAQESIAKPLRQEARQVFDAKVDWATVVPSQVTTDGTLTTKKLTQLKFSEACLRESLRKYSVVPLVARRTIRNLTLTLDNHRYTVPKGATVLINIQAVHLDEKFWPKPYVYDPTRFLPEQAAKIQPYTFLPFIAGPRNCLGQHLALLESKMVISLLMQRYQFHLPAGQTVQTQPDWSRPDLDPRHRFMVPVIPKDELMVLVTRREDKSH